MLCEVCIDSLSGAKAALQGGADRLELCGDLTTGGITPSLGLLQAVVGLQGAPVMVMVRPRGGDFCYDDDDIAVMCRDVAAIRSAGAAGVVIGALRPDGSLDLPALRQLAAAAAGLSITFHRAFDVCCDAYEACRQLMELRIDRVLTSGQQPTAQQGIPLLRSLQAEFGDKLTIMPGGGLREENVADIVSQTGVREVHFSGSVMVASPMAFQRPAVSMASGAGGEAAPPRPHTDARRVATLRNAAQRAADQDAARYSADP